MFRGAVFSGHAVVCFSVLCNYVLVCGEICGRFRREEHLLKTAL